MKHNPDIKAIRARAGCLIPKLGAEVPSCHEKTFCDCIVSNLCDAFEEREAAIRDRDEMIKETREWLKSILYTTSNPMLLDNLSVRESCEDIANEALAKLEAAKKRWAQ